MLLNKKGVQSAGNDIRTTILWQSSSSLFY